ncbi:MAG: alanine--tRNA ligase, partial [Acidobacteriota bacterium]|nr:alanine--tRNA ligase [Acidobacteriota bacterium]
MPFRSGSQIREDFLRFFEGKQHRRVHSASLVPVNDPTLLFTNAGMNQFKDVFLGAERRPYTRAATSQKCVRAGGKHNDLENVGFTRRHHTFFEMLGNFSFGDYFKREAIAFAWELLTSPEWWAIDPARLYVTIFEGNEHVARDDEAEQFWIETGVPKERIFAMSAKDNFWQMGETGPCGPCSEIFYDFGLAASEHTDANGNPQDVPFPDDAQRYVEIWNLVFMQFDRFCVRTEPVEQPDGSFREQCVEYGLNPLPKPSIDTGMGLERIACVLQNVLSNYQTDLFTPLLARAAQLTSVATSGTTTKPGAPSYLTVPQSDRVGHRAELDRTPSPAPALDLAHAAVSEDKQAASLRIIADHARCATFLIADGVLPANEGSGYVLRKIMRRGIRHGRLLGQDKPFLHHMVDAVRDEMASAYPELNDAADRIAKVVLAEEQQFARVMDVGSRRLDAELNEHRDAYKKILATLLRDSPSSATTMTVPFDGRRAFYLYETFGLPVDFIQDAALDAGLPFDMPGFERAKEEEQARARASWKGGSQKSASPLFRDLPKTTFAGYSALRLDGARILALIHNGIGVPSLAPGDSGEVVLDATSFYADSGGQVGDIGTLQSHSLVIADVSGASKPVQGVWSHRVLARHRLTLGDTLDTVVDPDYRGATTRNHTGTHLLHAALRQVLGPHVKQAGSLVDPTRLRFDFSHFAGVAEEELAEVETIVNHQVLADSPVETFVDVPIDQAINEFHATALFGEKYGDRVRVVTIGGPGGFSTELCGGTHVARTGEIGLLKLTGEGSVSSGVRRVEAVSGMGALSEFRRDFSLARTVSQLVGGSTAADASPAEALRLKLAQQEEDLKRLRRELDAARIKQASSATGASEPVVVNGVKLLVQQVAGLDRGPMRDLVDQLRGKLGSGVVVLGSSTPDGKVALIAGVTKDLTARIQAGKLIGQLAALVGGKGGGRPDLAEAGGTDAAALD